MKLQLTVEQRATWDRMRAHLKADARRFDMDVFGRHIAGKLTPDDPPCRTVLCIAGTVLLIEKLAKFKKMPYLDSYHHFTLDGIHILSDSGIEELVLPKLGLTKEQGERLFYTISWPDDLKEAYKYAPTAEARLEVGLRRMDLMLEEGR